MKKRKGFTLVELLVVIAILAILAAVSVVGYLGFTNKAKESNDVVMLMQANTILQAERVGEGQNKTPHDAVLDLRENGLDVTKLTPTRDGYDFVYDLNQDIFFLIDSENKVIAPDKTEISASKTNVFKFIGNRDSLQTEYGNYLKDDYIASDTLAISTSLDVGSNQTLKNINYDNKTEAQNVLFRTLGGTLTIDAPNADVEHYGWIENLNIKSVRQTHCYHEHGFVGLIQEFQTGKYITEKDALFHQPEEQVDAVFTSKDYIKGDSHQYGQHYFDENGICVMPGCHVTNDDHKHSYDSETGECICGDNINSDIEIYGIDEVTPYYFVGDTFKLNTNVNGVTWKSSDPESVSVDQSGTVSFLKSTKGRVQITAERGTKKDVVEVIGYQTTYLTNSGGDNKLKIDESTWAIIIQVDKKEQYEVTCSDDNVLELKRDISNNHIKYSVTAKASGSAYISIKVIKPSEQVTSNISFEVVGDGIDFNSGEAWQLSVSNWLGGYDKVNKIYFDFEHNHQNIVSDSTMQKTQINDMPTTNVYYDKTNQNLYVLDANEIQLPTNLKDMFYKFNNVTEVHLINFELKDGNTYDVSNMFTDVSNKYTSIKRIYVKDEQVDWNGKIKGSNVFHGGIISNTNQELKDCGKPYADGASADHAFVGYSAVLYFTGAFSVYKA